MMYLMILGDEPMTYIPKGEANEIGVRIIVKKAGKYDIPVRKNPKKCRSDK